MIKPNAISASITKQIGIACAVFRIMHISVTVYLKPVNVCLVWQTTNISHGRKDYHSLLQLVKTEFYMIINHAMIANTPFVEIGIAFIIGDVIPHC